jgi:hypothetical protein
MKKNKLLLIFILGIVGCESKIELVENEKELVRVEEIVDSKFVTEDPAFGKSKAEKEWIKLFRDCIKHTIFKKPKYMGLSLKNTIGTVVNLKEGTIQHFAPKISSEDSTGIIGIGEEQSLCYLNLSRDFSFNLLLKPMIDNIPIDSVKLGIENSRNRVLTGGKFREITIAQLKFKSWVDNLPDNSDYKKAISNENSVFVSHYLWVSNFTFDVKIDNDNLLGAWLKSGSGISKILGGGDLRINRIRNDSIRISASNALIPLVQFSKYKM